jgi:cytochrome P450
MGLESLLYALMGYEASPSFLTKVLILVGTLFVMCSLFMTRVYCMHQYKLRRFSGPFAVPLLGNCYSPAVVASLFKFLSSCRKTYSKVFRIFLFHTPFIVVCDPSIVRRILSDTRTFPKGEKYSKIFGIIFGGGLVTSAAEKHKADKALFNKYFIRSSVSQLIPSMNHHVLSGIEEFISSSIGEGEEKQFDCEKIFSRLSLRVFMNFAFDFDLSDQPENEKEVCNVVSTASCQVGNMIAFNIPNWSFLPVVRSLKTLPQIIMKYLQPVIDKRREQLANGTVLAEEKDDPLTMMVSAFFLPLDVLYCTVQ